MRLETRAIKRIEVGETSRKLQTQAMCPNCEVWGDIDEEQLAGTVSLVCPECNWHGYIDGRVA